jgi:hypothetical protein
VTLVKTLFAQHPTKNALRCAALTFNILGLLSHPPHLLLLEEEDEISAQMSISI